MNGPEVLSHICSPALSSAISVLQSVVQQTVHRPGKGHLLTIKCMEHALSNNPSTITIMEVDSMFQMRWGICPLEELILALQDMLVSRAQVIHQVPKVGKTLPCNRDLTVSLSLSNVATQYGLHLQLYLARPQMVSLEGAFWSLCTLWAGIISQIPLYPHGAPHPCRMKYRIPQADKQVRLCPLYSWAAAGGGLCLVGKFQGKFRPLQSSPSGLTLGWLSGSPARHGIYIFQSLLPHSSASQVSRLLLSFKRETLVSTKECIYFQTDILRK